MLVYWNGWWCTKLYSKVKWQLTINRRLVLCGSQMSKCDRLKQEFLSNKLARKCLYWTQTSGEGLKRIITDWCWKGYLGRLLLKLYKRDCEKYMWSCYIQWLLIYYLWHVSLKTFKSENQYAYSLDCFLFIS